MSSIRVGAARSTFDRIAASGPNFKVVEPLASLESLPFSCDRPTDRPILFLDLVLF